MSDLADRIPLFAALAPIVALWHYAPHVRDRERLAIHKHAERWVVTQGRWVIATYETAHQCRRLVNRLWRQRQRAVMGR